MELSPHPEDKSKVIVRFDSQQEVISWRAKGTSSLVIYAGKTVYDLATGFLSRQYPYEATTTFKKLGQITAGLATWPQHWPAYSGEENFNRVAACEVEMLQTITDFWETYHQKGIQDVQATFEAPPTPAPSAYTPPERLWSEG